MNELKIFSNTEFGKLSVSNTGNTIYFFLGEVCKCLGYTKQAKGKTYLRKDKIINICDSLEIKGLSPSDNFELITPESDFDTLRITEDALYDLILESKAKNARRFRKWITTEILPSRVVISPYRKMKITNYSLLEQFRLPLKHSRKKMKLLQAKRNVLNHWKKLKKIGSFLWIVKVLSV